MKLYRIEDGWDGGGCHDHDDFSPSYSIASYKVLEFDVVRETERSYVIGHPNDGRFHPTLKQKYVLKGGKNIYAWDTLEKAMYNYLKRKEYQEDILQQRLDATKSRLRQIREAMKKEKAG